MRAITLRVFARLLCLLALAGAASTALAQAGYRVGPGDVLKILVFQANDLTLETRVSEQGTITVPLIGELQVNGLSTSEIERRIERAMREGGFLQRPNVNVNVAQFRSLQVSVLGFVGKPGKFPLEQSRNRLSEVIAMAGGVLPGGADSVTVLRQENGKEVRIDVDLPGLFSDEKVDDVLVRNGDAIYVARAPVFYIYGEVQRPGQYRIERGMTLAQAIATGGGLTLRASDREVRIDRKRGGRRTVARDALVNERIEPDDVIYVRESVF